MSVDFDDIDVRGKVQHEVTLSPQAAGALMGTLENLCSGHPQCVQEGLHDFYQRLSAAPADFEVSL